MDQKEKQTSRVGDLTSLLDALTVVNIIVDGKTGLVYPGDTRVESIRGYDL